MDSTRLTYEKPDIVSFDSEQLLEWIGPVQGAGVSGGASTQPYGEIEKWSGSTNKLGKR